MIEVRTGSGTASRSRAELAATTHDSRFAADDAGVLERAIRQAHFLRALDAARRTAEARGSFLIPLV